MSVTGEPNLAMGDLRRSRPTTDLVGGEESLAKLSDTAQLLTVLFTDIVGSTELAARRGDENARAIRRLHDQLVRQQLAAHGGREVQTTGDGFLVTFRAVGQAVNCACAIQRAQLEHNQRHPNEALSLRMGLHVGEVSRRDDGLFGSAVNLAARVTAKAAPNEVLVSEVVKHLAGTIPGVEFRDRGRFRLRGFAERWRLYQLIEYREVANAPVVAETPSEEATLPAAAGMRSDQAQNAGKPGNLPIRLSSFVGRERELATLRSLMVETRLLTIVGAGGMGKTRLGLTAADEVGHDSAWFVDLAPVTSPNLIWEVIAAAVGMGNTATVSAKEAVCHYFGKRSSLVLLDNCEHLVAAVAETTSILLRRCPRVLVVATSREPLRIEGEVVWETPPMHEDEALHLFQDRTRYHRDGAMDAPPPAELLELVRCLDCMPLAIELAAAQTLTMTVRDLVERLDDRLRLLSRGDRLAVPRQQTLYATLEWSYGLLDDDERRMFGLLSVFAGGFTLHSAEQICADNELPAQRVTDLVARLVEKSLVQFEISEGAGRYRLLETVRAFATERLGENEDGTVMNDRHARYFHQLVDQIYRHRRSPQDAPGTVGRVDRERDNVRAALDWMRSTDADAFVEMVAALIFYWGSRGYIHEGCEYGAQAVFLASRASERQVWLLRSLAMWERERGNVDQALRYCYGAIRQARELGDHSSSSLAIRTHAETLWVKGTEVSIVKALAEQAVREARLSSDELELAMALNSLGFLRVEIGEVALGRADLEASLRLEVTRKELGVRALVLESLARAIYLQGDLDQASALWSETLAINRSLDDHHGAAWSIEGLAHLKVESEPIAALRLAAGAVKLCEEHGSPLPMPLRDRMEWLKETRASLSAQLVEKAWSDGSAMSFDDLVAAALSGERHLLPRPVIDGDAPAIASSRTASDDREEGGECRPH